MAAYEFVVCDPSASRTERDVHTYGPSVVDVLCTTSTGASGHPVTILLEPTTVYQQMPADVALDAAHIAAVWASSFGLVIICFLIARAVGACLELIRKG